MKRLITLVLVCVVLGLVGCTGLTDIVDAFKAENPNVTITAVDEDGDGTKDALFADTDGDGIVDTEVPGSREYLSQAGMMDTNIADILKLIGTGIAGFGTAGMIWRKYKPFKRAAAAGQTFGGDLVNAIQDVRKNGTLTPEALTSFNAALHEAQRHYTGLEAAVKAVKDGKQIPTPV